MKKKQLSLSFFYSFLTHGLLFLVIIFIAYFVRREVIEDEKGGGSGEVWVELSSMNAGSDVKSEIGKKSIEKSSVHKSKKETAVLSEKKPQNTDALTLRQKEQNELENKSPNPEKAAGSSVLQKAGGEGLAQGQGSGSGLGQGEGRGQGQGNASASVLGLIRRKIEQAKRYPVLARTRRIEGVAVLSFSINASGGVEALKSVKSSGSELLDEEALATVRRAAPFPYYALPIQISIKFSLE